MSERGGRTAADVLIAREALAPYVRRARRLAARLALAGMTLVGVYALLVVYEAVTTSFRDRPLDVSVYYAAATALRQNPTANIYDPAVLAQAVHSHAGCALSPGASYLYPPLLAILFEPFTALPCDVAIRCWVVCNLALWAFCVALLVYWLQVMLAPSLSGGRPARVRVVDWLRGEPDGALLATLGIIALSVLAWPVLQGLLMGQVNLLLLAALLVVPLLVRKERYVAAGMVLAFGTMLKLLPALLIAYYLCRGRRRVVLGAVLGMALLTGLTVLVVGWRALPDVQIILSSSYAQTWSDNQALAHAPRWVAVELGVSVGSPLAALAGRALLGLAALLVGAGLLVVWAPWCRAEAGGTLSIDSEDQRFVTELLGYGWTIGAMLLVSPLVWLHYNTWLLVPFTLATGYLLREHHLGRAIPRSIAAALLVVGGLLFLPWSLALDGSTYTPGPFVASIALRPLLMLLHPAAVLLLWCIVGWAYLRAVALLPRRQRPMRQRLSSMPSA